MTAPIHVEAEALPDSMFSEVQIIPPSLALQRKVGGSAARLITPLVKTQADKAVDFIKPEIRAEVERLLSEIQEIARVRKAPWRDAIWNRAHEIRGLAGTCDAVNLGRSANLLCLYLNGTDSDFVGEAGLVTSITVLASQSLKFTESSHELMPVLLTDSLQAIHVQCRREGRSLIS